MKLELEQIISNRYQILEQIGVGGMANVYCANDIKLDRKVTFKVLKEEFVDEEFIKKFNKEATAAAKISHLNIANVYDFGNDGNIYYIVMEYVDGYTLKDIIKLKAPFSDEEIIGVTIQIATALSVAHNSGIVHRDIKPENILISKEGSVKVTDFGIARATSSNTITTDNMGSVHYFSPEQARGGFTDFKTDIYSLGIVMYEMVTGRLPFDGEGVVQLAMKHINDPLPNMREFNPNISQSFEKIILKATQKNADNRYKSIDLLIQDLKKALSDKNGDFITEEVFTDSPTVMITPEQLDLINEISTNNEEKDHLSMDNRKNLSKKISLSSSNLKDTKKSLKQKSKQSDLEKKVTFFAILMGISIVIIITTFLFFADFSARKSKVPNFTGKTYEEAVLLAESKEIYIRNTEEDYSNIVEEGSIISQSIEAGTSVKKGTIVDITLSLGTGKFELPDFVNMDIAQVYREIENISIKLKEDYIYDDQVERGKVIMQLPKAGQTVSPNDEVTLYISKGEEESFITVPNLINLKEEDARVILENIGLSVGTVITNESETVEAGRVISQSINSGNKVEEGKSISLVISSKKNTQEVLEEESTQQEEPIIESYSEQNEENTTTEESTDTPEQETETNTLQEATLVISPSLDEDVTSVEVRVIKILNGEQSEIYINNHNVTDFPLRINVRGSEPTEFKLYIDGKLIGTETKFN